jgi:hypothetical protein
MLPDIMQQAGNHKYAPSACHTCHGTAKLFNGMSCKWLRQDVTQTLYEDGTLGRTEVAGVKTKRASPQSESHGVAADGMILGWGFQAPGPASQ